MKQIVIRKHYSYFLTDSSEMKGNINDAKMDKFDEELRELLNKHNMSLILHETRFIPMDKMSVCYCNQCNNFMVNRDLNPAGFDGCELYTDLDYVIYDGGVHEGRNLCSSCLPVTHRWGHFS